MEHLKEIPFLDKYPVFRKLAAIGDLQKLTPEERDYYEEDVKSYKARIHKKQARNGGYISPPFSCLFRLASQVHKIPSFGGLYSISLTFVSLYLLEIRESMNLYNKK